MIAQVALPVPIFKNFTYRVPLPLEPFIKTRVRVRVPFAKRSLIGVVVGIEEDQEDGFYTPSDISDIIDIEPFIDSAGFSLCTWAAKHHCIPLGWALKASFPLSSDLEKYLTINAEGDDHLGVDGLRLKKAYAIAGKEKVWQYCRQGLLRVCDVFTMDSLGSVDPSSNSTRGFSATLYLSQVRSRKEYYLSKVLPFLESGLNALLLLPDQGVAGDYLHRFFQEQLGERVLYFGSKTSAKRRSEVYFRLKRQGGLLVLGTRSGLFLPSHNLGLIIVERPEDEGYRNDQTLQFNAVAVATKLAELQNIPICYGSVSPPLDLIKGVEEGSVELVAGEIEDKPLEVGKIKRFTVGEKPPQEFIDIIEEGLSFDERIVIHTPLKDYAARLYCMSCRQSILCPVCESAVSFKKEDNSLVCWRCGRQFPYEERCTHCGSELISFGSTGTEFIEEYIRSSFADVPIFRITGETVKSKSLSQLVNALSKPRTVIVGTQILSRLYEVGPIGRLILLGWEDFLRIAGYRAREHIYQTYYNLIDALRPARVHLLTTGKTGEPEEVLTATREEFCKHELERRLTAEFPPYVRLFLLKVDSANKASAQSTAERLRALLKAHGLEENVIGESARPGERGRLTILLRGEGSALDDLLPELGKVRNVRIEADPPWV
jgi:primosomal protein N' (replication factor Y) (superfamily II helicase)